MADKKTESLHLGSTPSVVNISFDTNSRQIVLSIDGVVTPITELAVHKSVFDGEEFLSFWYTVEVANENGMIETRQFFLPNPSDAAVMATVDKRGFASKIAYNDEKAKADIIDFIKQSRNAK